MAKKTILVSDLTGAEIKNSEHARVVVTHGRDRYEADVAIGELSELLAVARKGKQRGRKPNEPKPKGA